MTDPAQGAQSIRRAFSILRTLAAGRDSGVRLIDIAATTGLSRPTVHRMLRLLADEGVVEQDPRSKRYAMGGEIGLLALARSSRSPLLIAAQPHLKRLADTLGDTVFLSVRTGSDTLCIARQLGQHPVQVLIIEVGARRPIGVGGASIAMLAALPPAESAAILLHNQQRLSSQRTATSHIAAQVDAARARGYAYRSRGLVPGTRAISVALPAGGKTPLAALTLAAIDRRLSPQRAAEVAAVLRAAADAIARP